MKRNRLLFNALMVGMLWMGIGGANAQKVYPEWAKILANSYGVDCSKIVINSKGELIITGTYIGTLSVGTSTYDSKEYDMYTAKFDNLGNPIWISSVSGTKTETGINVCVDNNNNIYATGFFNSTSITIGSTVLTNSGSLSRDMVIVKYTDKGDILWAKKFGGINEDKNRNIKIDKNGNIYLIGEYYGSMTIENKTINSRGRSDIFILKLDPSGNLIWLRDAGGKETDYAQGMDIDSKGNIYISGTFSTPSITFSSTKNSTVLNSSNYENLFIAKYNTLGELIWTRKSEKGTGSRTSDLCVDINDNIFIVGEAKDTISFDTISNSYYSNFIYVAKFDTSGKAQWIKKFICSTPYVDIYRITSDIDGNAYITGNFEWFNGLKNKDYTNDSYRSRDLFFLKLKPNGDLAYSKSIGGGDSHDEDISLITDKNRNIYITGSSYCDTIYFDDKYILNPTPYNIFISKYLEKASATNNGPLCLGNELKLSASSINGASYKWTGPNGFTSIEQNPIVSKIVNASMSGRYVVVATVNGVERQGDTTTVTINSEPVAPVVTNSAAYCQGATANQLSATGTSLRWYTVPSGGSANITAPTPSTSVAGNTKYYVSQTINSCESPRAEVSVSVNPIPTAPVVSAPSTYCQNAIASQLAANGNNLLWYTDALGGTGILSAITPATSTPGNASYYVSQTVNGCESPRALITVTVNPIPAAPSVSAPAAYCQNATATTLVATGNQLAWYNVPTDRSGGSSIAPTPSTANAGTASYYVTQTDNGCESPRAKIDVVVNPAPTTPTVSSALSYCQNEIAPKLTATGTNVLWYGNATTDQSSSEAPTPSTLDAGILKYYATQTVNGCESPRAEVAVTVKAAPAAPVITQNGADLVSNITTGNQWYNQTGVISNATSKVYTPTKNDNYYCIATQNGCSSPSSNMINVVISGIDARSSSVLSIYPNPVINQLTIDNSGNPGEIKFEIMNAIGQVVTSGMVQDKTIVPTTSFMPGIYMIRLDNGKKIEVRKFVKE